MPTSSMRRVGLLLDVARFHIPRRVDGDGNYRDWRIVAPGFLGLAATTVEAIYQLPLPRGRVPAETLTRTLVDYAITFAWLAAPKDEAERGLRLARFELTEFNDRLEAHKRYATILPERGDGVYSQLISAGKMPDGLLEQPMLDRIAQAKAEPGAKGMPPLLDRAVEADSVWMEELDVVARQPLAHVYAGVFSSFSAVAHASVTGIGRMVAGAGPSGEILAGTPSPVGTSRIPAYGLACSLFTYMLLIASRRTGFPPENDVRNAADGWRVQ